MLTFVPVSYKGYIPIPDGWAFKRATTWACLAHDDALLAYFSITRVAATLRRLPVAPLKEGESPMAHPGLPGALVYDLAVMAAGLTGAPVKVSEVQKDACLMNGDEVRRALPEWARALLLGDKQVQVRTAVVDGKQVVVLGVP